jgi:hypothetical protein
MWRRQKSSGFLKGWEISWPSHSLWACQKYLHPIFLRYPNESINVVFNSKHVPEFNVSVIKLYPTRIFASFAIQHIFISFTISIFLYVTARDLTFESFTLLCWYIPILVKFWQKWQTHRWRPVCVAVTHWIFLQANNFAKKICEYKLNMS